MLGGGDLREAIAVTSMKSWGSAGLAALVVLAACGTRTDDDDRTTQVAPPITATSTPADPVSVPATSVPTTESSAAPSTAEAPPTTREAIEVAAGCSSPTSGFTPGESTEHIVTVGEGDRTYLVYVPTSHDPGTPTPVVYNFHGFVTGALIQSRVSELDDKAEEAGFITVTPDGLGPETIAGEGTMPYWNISGSDEGADDLAFIDELVDQTRSDLCVDNDRTYAVGLSNGGHMATRLACQRATTFAAVATIAGSSPAENCDSPIPFLAIHGTDDTFVLYDGGLGDGLDQLNPPPELDGLLAAAYKGIELAPATDAITTWADHNGCGDDPVLESIGEEVERWVWEDCSAPVVFYVVDGGGGTWPGSEVFAVISEAAGHTTFDIEANEIIWDFFSEHSL
jgi:polyhydroxybutyrate depolymerase